MPRLCCPSANKLNAAGANFLSCPDNTIHQALPWIQDRLPLPWLHITEVVAAYAVERGCKRLGLTGTRWLVASPVYPEKIAERGLQFARPCITERDDIHRLIMDELVRGIFTTRATAYFLSVISGLKDREERGAVVLGCTEIPLIINDDHSPLPTLDSTRLLARAALSRAAQNG